MYKSEVIFLDKTSAIGHLEDTVFYLEFININLTAKEDIPYVLNYLDTAKPYKDEAYNKWNRYLKGIDYKKRAKELKDDQFYAPFCR